MNIEQIKEIVAERYNYPDGILGTRWEYAMTLTHRRKRQIELYEEVLKECSERQINTNHSEQHDSKALHIADVRLSLSKIQKAARMAVIKTKKSKGMKTNKITERELELAERAYINGAIWAKNTIKNNKA